MPTDLRTTSLLVVDAQRGFSSLCPAELPVPGALELVPALNRLLAMPFARIDFSQDWHPADHCSFHGRRDSLYPPHCVIGTPGSEFLPGLNVGRAHAIWRKGYDSNVEAYAVTAQHPAFAAFLTASGIRTVVVAGVARNICCHFAALDLRRAGLEVVMPLDATAGIDVPAAGLFVDAAREEGEAAGVGYAATFGG